MKTMTCKELGGACNQKFSANTFEEITELSKKHGTEMYHKGDEAHLAAMGKMMELMENPEAMKQWLEEKRTDFDNLPKD